MTAHAANADLPLIEGRTYHVAATQDSLPRRCIIVGSPARADRIAREMLTDAQRVEHSDREYRSYRGLCNGTEVGVVTHHMGSGSIGSILDEIHFAGGRTIIRVGSCSSMRVGVEPGDIVIPEAAIRWDGASDEMLASVVPAIANRQVVNTLEEQAQRLGFAHHSGISATTVTFGAGQGRPNLLGRIRPEMQARLDLMREIGVVACEMEIATLFAWAIASGGVQQDIRVGAVCAVYANRARPKGELVEAKGDTEAIHTALSAIITLP